MLIKTSFLSEGLRLFGIISIPEGAKRGVVFLHGGGDSNTSRYEFLQKQFEKKDIASLSFDFRGCGHSEGIFEEGSLEKRLIDAEAALLFFKKISGLNLDNIYVWGSSMGAHIACRLTERHPSLAGVILQSPAAYGEDAEITKLNEEFADIIRTPNSWNKSPAFNALALFKGRKFIVLGENDVIIPEKVKEKYRKLSQQNGSFIILKGGAHRLLSPQNKIETKALHKLSDIAAKFIIE